MPHVCPWWGGYFLDNPVRRLLHRPEQILAPYVRPGMTVLDFGCGMGLFSLAAARLVGEQGKVIAVDLQPQMLAALGRRAAKAGLQDRIRFHRSEPDRIGLAEPCDLVLAFWSAQRSSRSRSTSHRYSRVPGSGRSIPDCRTDWTCDGGEVRRHVDIGPPDRLPPSRVATHSLEPHRSPHSIPGVVTSHANTTQFSSAGWVRRLDHDRRLDDTGPLRRLP